MKRFKNILFVKEPGEVHHPGLERTVALAESNQARLTVIEVIENGAIGFGMPEYGPIASDLQSKMTKAVLQSLNAAVRPYGKRIEIQTKVIAGIKFLEIIREVLGNRHDLVIKAAEATGSLSRLFGSDDMHLLRKCPCPIWLIKPARQQATRRILAAIDIDNRHKKPFLESQLVVNRQIIELASSLALSGFAELHIVHAWQAYGESAMRSGVMHTPKEQVIAYVEHERQRRKSIMDEIVHEVSTSLGQETLDYLMPTAHLVNGRARIEIPVLAERIKAELIVMGTVARTGIPGFIMGNTAETILNHVSCSVLAIKPPGFVTPVTVESRT